MKNKRVLIIFAILIIIIPLILYKILTTPSIIGIINIAHVGDFIGYYGAVLGGLLTLAGVRVTIKRQEISDNKNRAAQYKPILTLVNQTTEELIQTSIRYSNIGIAIQYFGRAEDDKPFWYESPSDYTLKWYYKIKNEGRGETTDARIEKMEIDKSDLKWVDPHFVHSNYSSQKIGEIIKQEEIGIVMNFPTYLYIKDEFYDKSERIFLNTKVTIFYKDAFQVNSYYYILHIRYEVVPQELIQRSYNNSNHSIARVGYKLAQIMPERKFV